MTVGHSGSGQHLVVAQAFAPVNATEIRFRIISAREATNRERQQYEASWAGRVAPKETRP